MAGLIDTHLHLSREEFDPDREAVRKRAAAAGVVAFLHVGFDPLSVEGALDQAEGVTDAWATAGLHPHEAEMYDPAIESSLRALGESGRIVAIGECGLDFFRDLSPRPQQREAFAAQIGLATELQLPMVFHVRDAYPESRALLEEIGLPPRRGVFHAFAGDAAFAAWAVGEGFKLGIGGPLTYKRSNLAEAIAGLPADSFLLETDSPWLPPQPWRGKRNEPAYLPVTAGRLAELCSLPLDDLADRVAATFEGLFRVRLSKDFWGLKPSECESFGPSD